MMRNWKYAALGVLAAGAISTGLGGSTLAAWSDTGSLGKEAEVASGFLDLDVTPAEGTTGWVDLTPKSGTNPVPLNQGKPIADLAAYRIVPGATIAYYGKVKVGLDGDNLNAKLVATYEDNGGATGELLTSNGGTDPKDKGVTPSVNLYKWDTDVATSAVAGNKVASDPNGTQLCSKQVAGTPGDGCNKGVLDKASFGTAGSATHLAVITLTFDKDATEKQNAQLKLTGINLSLKQTTPASA